MYEGFSSDENGHDTYDGVADLALDINNDCDNNDDGELDGDDTTQKATTHNL